MQWIIHTKNSGSNSKTLPPAPVISIATLFVLEIHITTVRICNSIRDNLRQSGYKNEKKNGAVEKHLHNILYHYITNFQKHRIEKKNPLEIGFKAYKINYENWEKKSWYHHKASYKVKCEKTTETSSFGMKKKNTQTCPCWIAKTEFENPYVRWNYGVVTTKEKIYFWTGFHQLQQKV